MKRIIAVSATIFTGIILALGLSASASASSGPVTINGHSRPASVPRMLSPDNNFGPYNWCASEENSLCWKSNGLGNQATIQTDNYWDATLIATSSPGYYYIQNSAGNCMDEHDNTGMFTGDCTNGDGRQIFGLSYNGNGNYNFINFTTGDDIITIHLDNGSDLWGGEQVSGNHYNWNYCSQTCS